MENTRQDFFFQLFWDLSEQFLELKGFVLGKWKLVTNNRSRQCSERYNWRPKRFENSFSLSLEVEYVLKLFRGSSRGV